MTEQATTLPAFNPSNNPVVDGIKSRTEDIMKYIRENCPQNRCASLAITNYEQAAMWAVKSNFT